MTNVTEALPARMVKWGCTLHRKSDGKTSKYVLEHKGRNYRGFIYLRDNYDVALDSSLNDLYSNFFYETGYRKVERA